MKKTVIAVILYTLLVASIQYVSLVNANPMPTVNTRIEIDSSENETYTASNVTLYFYVWESVEHNIYYSLDNQEMMIVDNLTANREYDLNAGKSPEIMVADLRGYCVLTNLSNGWHNITIYEISNYSLDNSQIVHSANTQFKIDIPPKPESFPIMPVTASVGIVAIVVTGLLVYSKKYRRRVEKYRRQNGEKID